MDHLSVTQVEELRARMQEELAQIQARLGESARARSGPDAQVVEDQDAAAIEDDRQRELQLGAKGRERLKALQDALQRMDDGEYGICQDSDEPIPYGRLALEPTTLYTVEAAESLEEGGDLGGTPGETPGAY